MKCKFKKYINYSSRLELKINFSLKGESCLWIFLRFTEDKFDDFTSIIKIFKEDKSKKIYIQFGAFVENEIKKGSSNSLNFCIFSTQQLIEISSKS